MSATNELQIPAHLQNAIVETIQVQLSTKVDVNLTMVTPTPNGQPILPIDVVSLMGIKSSQHTGSIALAFPKATFFKFLETMIGETHTEVNNQNADACSELLNIIYASARVKINEAGFDFQPAIPATVCGTGIWFPVAQFNNFIRFDCDSEKGKFLLAFALKRTK